MDRIVIIKNNRTSAAVVYEGQEIAAESSYTIQTDGELLRFAGCTSLIHDLTEDSPQTVINDGSSDLSAVQGVNWLTGNTDKRNKEGVQLVDMVLRRGQPGDDGFTIVSHDLTDRTTWYQASVRVSDCSLVDSGDHLTFQAEEGKRHWVNIYSRKLTIDHNKILLKDGTLAKEEDFAVVVKVDGVVTTEGFTIDFTTGSITFSSSQENKTITATFNHNDVDDASNFIVRPVSNCKYLVEHVEIQFSKNMSFNDSHIQFEVWAGDPSYSYYGSYSDEMFHYAWGQHENVLFRAVSEGLAWTIAAGTQGVYVPFDGSSTISAIVSAWNTSNPDLAITCLGDDSQVLAAGGLFLIGGFGQMRTRYRGMRDLINWCNNQYPVIPACGELQYDIMCFPFRYLVPAELNPAQGALVRLFNKDDVELTGEIATITFYMLKVDP
jgi:hypothetical protein